MGRAFPCPLVGPAALPPMPPWGVSFGDHLSGREQLKLPLAARGCQKTQLCQVCFNRMSMQAWVDIADPLDQGRGMDNYVSIALYPY